MTRSEVERLDRCLAAGGVAIFGADTVYGLAAGAESAEGVARLYRIKGRPADRPAAVMFFQLERALDALPELGARTRAALARLLPGAVTVVVPNPAARFPLACGPRPDRLGLRVPALAPAVEPLAGLPRGIIQSSANPSGASDARRLEDVEPRIREEADLELDAGELPGLASTVVDLSSYERDGGHTVLRDGAVDRAALAAVL